ncbi:hypothetical protein CA267_000580 [Alteromonas pelagimontana]|uniref:Lipoprotein n=1 Tax=Alteromonas pelagimontana TaxID=1858656 RepID=A0A6M4M8C6_9ALTE|nr:hypothetical protein [Alteromonas pelagimontana]QJR79397.1 hypothetical protein CA267_000580 [Alteromonas pelagimontana]
MFSLSFKRTVFVILSMMMLSACGEKEEGLGRYGMLHENTPEYTSVKFMQSIYLEPDISQAVALSTNRLARILRSYHTNSNVQRHVMNLKFDSVVITPEGGGKVGRSQFSDKATVTLFFSGEVNDERREDLRRVELIKENGTWKVSRIHPDHFM